MKLKKIYSIFIILGLILLILLSGCNKTDCSKKDTTYIKYKLDENSGNCVVYKNIPKNKCGNGIAEDGETYCNCPTDVSKTDPKNGCFGNIGDYLTKSCDKFSKKCVLTENSKVILKNKEMTFKNYDLYLTGDVSYKSPYILNTAKPNKIKISISLFKFVSDMKKYENIIIKDLYIEDANGDKLGEIDYNTGLAKPGDKLPLKEITLSDTAKYDYLTTLKFKIDLTYKVDYLDTKGKVIKTENKIETLTAPLSRFEIINPNFYKNKR